MDDLPIRPGEDKAQKGDLRAAVIEYVNAQGSVTFVELQNYLSPYIEVRGEAELSLPNLNLVLWAGVSDEFANFVQELWGDPDLVADGCSPMEYLWDGGALNLPIAKRPPKQGYKEPHWAPMVLRPRSAVE